MSKIIKLIARDGSEVEFVDEIIGSGAMKDVYFSPDKSYVIGFFRKPQDANAIDRLENITGIYRERIFNQKGGDYWKDLFCWPTKLVDYQGKIGIVSPTYAKQFFFEYGSVNNDFLGIKGKEKEGKWFTSAKNQNRFLDLRERGDWFKYFQICIRLSRAAKRLHAAGLAHSDLSYKNVLVDPTKGLAAIIDIDGLVVPGKYPPDVIGTPDFIAPEVMATKNLPLDNPNRCLPSIATDRHALAVMIYMYLFFRHPLRGSKVYDLNASKDEELSMGKNALFIENKEDTSNSVNTDQIPKDSLPQANPNLTPYTLAGPILTSLFNKAFIDGLHQPSLRPTADEWEQALIKTVDLMQNCKNPNCWHKWFILPEDKKQDITCPFCNTKHEMSIPIFHFYSNRFDNEFIDDKQKLVVFNNQYLYQWHINSMIFPNERLTAEQKIPVGYFVFHQNKWFFINQRLTTLKTKDDDLAIEINKPVELKNGLTLLFGNDIGSRIAKVEIINE